ncbi:MAG TPA: hypothetical protein VIG88_04095 [Lysobacter sp.]
MKPYLLLPLALATQAHADDFAARVVAAKAAAVTIEGFAYDTAMGPAIHHVLVPCVPKGTDPGRGGEFVLVANVDATGRPSAIEARPSTPLARCFAKGFGALRLQPPPKRPSPYPVVVEMQIRP